MTIDQFLHDLQPKQILRQKDRKTLNFQMATQLAMVPPEKENRSNKKKTMKIGTFFQKLLMNSH